MNRLRILLLTAVVSLTVTAYAQNFDFQDISSGLYFKIVTGGVEIVRGTSLNRGDITIPKSVTYGGKTYPVVSINASTWQLLYDVNSVTMKEGSVVVRDGAFYKCTRLSSIEFPQAIVIESMAFSGCNGLQTFRSHDMNPTAFNDNCFDAETYKSCTLYVPAGTKNLYMNTTGWKNFFNIIEDVKAGIVLDEAADNQSNIDKGQGVSTYIQLKRLFSSEHWNTICVPFDISQSLIKEVFGGASIKQFSSVDGTVMKFTTVTSVTAGVPYLIQPAVSVSNPVFPNVKMTVTKETVVTKSTAGHSYQFVGVFSPLDMKTDGTEQYLGKGNLLYIPRSDANDFYGLAAFYRIPWDNGEQAKVQIVDDMTSVARIQSPAAQSCYGMNGIPTNAVRKGVYIIGGKKIIFR